MGQTYVGQTVLEAASPPACTQHRAGVGSSFVVSLPFLHRQNSHVCEGFLSRYRPEILFSPSSRSGVAVQPAGGVSEEATCLWGNCQV